ncbi:MAG: TonB-dependent receptor, partial [Bacteroidales bacterium]|nr:TonB-dependent receptor [Bacteroidales bacterium]
MQVIKPMFTFYISFFTWRIPLLIIFSFLVITIQTSGQNYGYFKGTVKADDNGETLIGAHIKLKGDLSTGAITNIDGIFSIEVKEGHHIFIISFTGMKTENIEVDIKANETINKIIRLKPYVNELQGVEIKVGRFDRPIEEITSTMEIIKPDIIQSKNVTNIASILDYAPGLNILDGEPQIRGGSGFTFGVGSKVGIFIDDMPLLSGDASRPYWDLIPTENIDQIEVVKGCASVLSGANALSGAIYIRTARPKLEPLTRVKVYNGIYSTPKYKEMKWWSDVPYVAGADYFHTRIIKNTDFTIGANVLFDHGYIGVPRATFPAIDTVTDFTDQQMAKQRYRLNFNIRQRSEKVKGLNYGLNGNFMYHKTNLVLAWLDLDEGFYRAYPGAVLLQDQFIFYLDPFVNFYSSIGINHSLKTRILYNNTDQSNDQQIKSAVYFADYNFSRKYDFLKDFAFVGGLTFQYNDVNSGMYTGSGSSNNYLLNLSGYAEIDFNVFKVINLSAGARVEHFNMNNNTSDTKPVFRGGLSLKLLQETYLRASVGQGYRYPTIAEKFIRMDVGSFGVFDNPGLVPESSLNAEIGVKQGFKFLKYFGYIDLAVFQQDYDNTIEYLFGQWDTISANIITDPFYGFRFINTGKSRIIGADLSVTGKAQLGKDAFLKTMIGYNYILPKTLESDFIFAIDSAQTELSYDSTSVDPSKNILKYRFLHTIKADIEFTFRKFSAGVSFKYFSRIENLDGAIEDFEDFTESTGGTIQAIQYMDYFNNHNNGNFILDFRISQVFKEKHKLSLIVDNLLNHWYSLRPLKAEQMRKVMLQYT